MHTDPIADLLTRIRNASMANHDRTKVPSSVIKKEILRVMKEKQAIQGFNELAEEGPKKMIDVQLVPGRLLSLKRVSTPGQRIYKKSTEIRPVLRGYGFSIISTSQGIMTGEDARKKGMGGELLCEIS